VSLGSRSICQAKHSLEVWDRFGIARRIVDKGITWEEGEVYLRDQPIWRFNLQPEPGHKFPAFVNLQQYYVEELLYERCLAEHWPEWAGWSPELQDEVLRAVMTFLNGLTASAVISAAEWPAGHLLGQLGRQLELWRNWAQAEALTRAPAAAPADPESPTRTGTAGTVKSVRRASRARAPGG